MSQDDSSDRQPAIMLAVPDHDVVNRAMMWVLSAVAFLALLCILVFSVADTDDANEEEDSLAPLAMAPYTA
jgi:hypothetical protein